MVKRERERHYRGVVHEKESREREKMGVSVAPRFYQQELEVGSFFSSSFLALAHQLRVGAQSE